MGRPAQTSRAAILQAALTIADEDGISAVSMQAVARRLGVTPMALYRHVSSKADLLDGLVELLLSGLPHPRPDLPSTERLSQLAHGLRDAAANHPGVFPLLLQRPVQTTAAVEIRDSVCGTLQEAGLNRDDAARAERLISTAILGFAASEAAGRFAHHDRAVLDADFACLLHALDTMILDLAHRPAQDSRARQIGLPDSRNPRSSYDRHRRPN